MDQQILYKYIKIETEQFATFEESFNDGVEELHFQTEVMLGYAKDHGALCNKIMVNISQMSTTILKVVVASYFEIAKESIEMLSENNKVVFPPNFLVQIASLNYGSIRGVIHAKTVNTKLNRIILPPFYFGNMIDKSFVAEL